MKGFVFTLDAIFALIVTAIGISIITYIGFVNPSPYALASGEAYGAMQTLLQTGIGSNLQGSQYFSPLGSASNGSAYAWPQFGRDGMLSSYTEYGQHPYLLYSYTAQGPIVPVIAVGDNYAVLESGNSIYTLDAGNGALVSTFTSNSPANMIDGAAIYHGMVFYANSSGYVMGMNENGNAALWNFSTSNMISTPIEIEGNHVAFGTYNGFYLLNPSNGTLVASLQLPLQVQVPLYTNGEYVIVSSSQTAENYISGYLLDGNVLSMVWNSPLSAKGSTAPASINNTIAVGSGNSIYVFSLTGNQVYSSTVSNSRVLGIGTGSNDYYVQAYNSTYALASNGLPLYLKSSPDDFQNTTPAVSASAYYSLIGGNFITAINTSTGRAIWNESLPVYSSYSGYSQISIAYGNMYAADGNTLYAFGTYKPRQGDSMLQSLASMYLQNQGSYSNAALYELFNSSNFGIMINGTYAPDLQIATFNGMSNVTIPNSGQLQLNKMTLSAWINPSAYPTASASAQIINKISDCALTANDFPYQLSINSTGYVSYELSGGKSFTDDSKIYSTGPAGLDKWSFITATYNGTIMKLYLNGVLQNTANYGENVAINSEPVEIGSVAFDGQSVGGCGAQEFFTGQIAGVQAYSSVLSATQISQLYNGGLFAKPVPNGDNLLWMPLVGNANDYSGYFHTGIPEYVSYTKTNYAPPSLSASYEVSSASVPLLLNVSGSQRVYNVSVIEWK